MEGRRPCHSRPGAGQGCIIQGRMLLKRLILVAVMAILVTAVIFAAGVFAERDPCIPAPCPSPFPGERAHAACSCVAP